MLHTVGSASAAGGSAATALEGAELSVSQSLDLATRWRCHTVGRASWGAAYATVWRIDFSCVTFFCVAMPHDSSSNWQHPNPFYSPLIPLLLNNDNQHGGEVRRRFALTVDRKATATATTVAAAAAAAAAEAHIHSQRSAPTDPTPHPFSPCPFSLEASKEKMIKLLHSCTKRPLKAVDCSDMSVHVAACLHVLHHCSKTFDRPLSSSIPCIIMSGRQNKLKKAAKNSTTS